MHIPRRPKDPANKLQSRTDKKQTPHLTSLHQSETPTSHSQHLSHPPSQRFVNSDASVISSPMKSISYSYHNNSKSILINQVSNSLPPLTSPSHQSPKLPKNSPRTQMRLCPRHHNPPQPSGQPNKKLIPRLTTSVLARPSRLASRILVASLRISPNTVIPTLRRLSFFFVWKFLS